MKKLILGLIFATFILLIASGIAYLRPVYQAHKEIRYLKQARAFLMARDGANASLSARVVLQINPRNLDACRIMADLAELGRSPSAIDWRRRMSELSPNVTNQLELAACALRLEHPPYPVAAQTLKELTPKADCVPGFHVLSAELALKLNRITQAAAHFRAAEGLEPDNPLHRLNLAALELQSTHRETAQASGRTLEQLSGDRWLGSVALRWLIVNQLRRNDLTKAELFSRRLISQADANLDDQLLHLAILQRLLCSPDRFASTNSPNDEPNPRPSNVFSLSRGTRGRGWGEDEPFSNTMVPVEGQAEVRANFSSNQISPAMTELRQEFGERLCSLKASASTNRIALFSICEWMGRHGLADDALLWLSNMDAKVRAAQPVPLAVANLHLAKGDWSSLESFLERQHWADLEFLRLALSARAAWGQNRSVLGDARWAASLRAARDHLGSSMLLLSLAAEWRRDREELLWQIHRRFPREQWALRELESIYNVAQNTRGLNRVYAELITEKPSEMDVTNCNNYACTSMLLGAHLPEAQAVARDLYQQHPSDVIVASTYAYSLHLQGRTREGLTVLAGFTPKESQEPSVALYYGVLLASAGENECAKPYLDRADKAHLLPEEKELLRKAKAR